MYPAGETVTHPGFWACGQVGSTPTSIRMRMISRMVPRLHDLLLCSPPLFPGHRIQRTGAAHNESRAGAACEEDSGATQHRLFGGAHSEACRSMMGRLNGRSLVEFGMTTETVLQGMRHVCQACAAASPHESPARRARPGGFRANRAGPGTGADAARPRAVRVGNRMQPMSFFPTTAIVSLLYSSRTARRRRSPSLAMTASSA